MEELQIEPELLTSPPRRTKRRGTRGFLTLVGQYILSPIFVLTACMVLWDIHLEVVRVAGPVVSSRIVNLRREHGNKENDWLYYVTYRALINGKTRTLTEGVSATTYKRVTVGSEVPLQISPIFPGYHSRLQIPGHDNLDTIQLLGFLCLLMIGGNSMLLWYMYILPIRRHRLVTSGIAVVGRLVDKTIGERGRYSNTKTPVYYFHYEYEPLAAATSLTKTSSFRLKGQQEVPGSDWNETRIGDTYTVLYDPKNPNFSLMYLFGDFEVASGK